MEETGTVRDERRVLALAMEAGRQLLENGAEIFRVEETMRRIAHCYGVDGEDFFVLSNGIFTTADPMPERPGGHYARVRHIPVRGARMDRVTAVNQLSREIGEGTVTLEQAEERLKEIAVMPGKPEWLQVLSGAAGAACFCVLFGGGGWDALAAGAAGLALELFLMKAGAKMSRIVGTILSSALAALVCVAFCRMGVGTGMSHMIIGAIIPLIPGVPFTNGIRDIADGDYISGAVRLLDALLGFVCIAIGVAVTLSADRLLTGGGLL